MSTAKGVSSRTERPHRMTRLSPSRTTHIGIYSQVRLVRRIRCGSTRQRRQRRRAIGQCAARLDVAWAGTEFIVWRGSIFSAFGGPSLADGAAFDL
jgi:hypothetical protein